MLATSPESRADPQEMFVELACKFFIDRLLLSQLYSHLHHHDRIERHPSGAIYLIETAAGRQRCTAVEHTDVIQPEEAPLEDVLSPAVFAVYPPGEIHQQFEEAAAQECDVSDTICFLVHHINVVRCPRMNRRINVSKIPFVVRYLAVWVHIAFAEH